MQVLIFVVLKIVEISVIVFIPYGIGLILKKTSTFEDDPLWMLWLMGFVAFTMIVGIGLLVMQMSMVNWEWASKLLNYF